MTDEKLRQSLHGAMERKLSGVQADPWMAQRVIAASKGEKPVKKKISASIVLVIALILLASAALAAGLGMFDNLSVNYPFGSDIDKERLSGLDSVSQSVKASTVTGDGIQVDIDKCYYEDDRVFISYRISGKTYECIHHEGVPKGDIQWDWEEKNFVYAENMISSIPSQQPDILWLNGEGQRWEEVYHASLHDGLMLMDGTYLDIIGGDIMPQEDGSIIGWKECGVPVGKRDETLEIKAVLFRTSSIKFQDGRNFYSATERGEQTDIPFTVKRNNDLHYLSGTSANETYQVAADFTVGQIDMKGEVRLYCPSEWVKAHDDWNYSSEEDLIEDFILYKEDEPLSNHGTESERYQDDYAIFFEQLYNCPNNLDGLKLVPVYTKTGAHPEEAIPLKQPVNR